MPSKQTDLVQKSLNARKKSVLPLFDTTGIIMIGFMMTAGSDILFTSGELVARILLTM